MSMAVDLADKPKTDHSYAKSSQAEPFLAAITMELKSQSLLYSIMGSHTKAKRDREKRFRVARITGGITLHAAVSI